MKKKDLPIIGWREWVDLPDLKIKKVKAKIDTGARSSSLHAFGLEFYKRGSKEFVSFNVHPNQEDNKTTVKCKAEVTEWRKVKSSNGQTELRPVIESKMKWKSEIWIIEMTLTNRDSMGFRMLLGRADIKSKALVDVSKSYLGIK